MPRYFFHRTDGGFDPDPDGIELRDIQDARIEAVVYAAETLKDRPDLAWTGQAMSILVSDDHGNLVYTVTISASEPDKPPPR